MSCKRWSCPSCAQAKRQEWLERFILATGGLSRLYCWTDCTGDGRPWARVRQAIYRAAGGKFLSVALGAGGNGLFVLCTGPVDGAEPIPRAAAIRGLIIALGDVPETARGRPVNCTKGWLPALPKSHQWRYECDIPASDPHFAAALKALHEDGHLWAKELAPGVAFWNFPEGTPEERRARFRERLFGHTLSVNARPKQEDVRTARGGTRKRGIG